MGKTIQSKVADAILQRPQEVTLGGKTYSVAPPSIGTLILVSELISEVPIYDVQEGKEITSMVEVAKNWKVLPRIYATLILGIKHINDEESVDGGGFFMRRKQKRKLIDILVKEIEDNVSPSELIAKMFPLIQSLELGDFFELTTFLQGIKLLEPTKVEAKKTTASGR